VTKVEEDNTRKKTLLAEIRRRLTGVAEREADLEEVRDPVLFKNVFSLFIWRPGLRVFSHFGNFYKICICHHH